MDARREARVTGTMLEVVGGTEAEREEYAALHRIAVAAHHEFEANNASDRLLTALATTQRTALDYRELHGLTVRRVPAEVTS